MSVLLAICSLLFSFASMMTYIEARRERKRKLVAGNQGENKVVNSLLDMGFENIASGFLVAGKNGKQAQIDIAVKVDKTVVVVETKNWSGIIRGGMKDSEWHVTKRNGNVTIHRNPVFQAARQARILYENTGHPAVGIVMMAGRAYHQDGPFPPGIASWTNLGEEITRAAAMAPARMKAREGAWEAIVAIAAMPDAQKKVIEYGTFLDNLIGSKPWLSWLALGAITGAAAIFIDGRTAFYLEHILNGFR